MKPLIYFFLAFAFVSCKPRTTPAIKDVVIQDVNVTAAVVTLTPKEITKPNSELEERLVAAGLVNIQTLDTSILVELKYSTTDNFVGVDLYGDLENAYLQPDVAEKFLKAQHFLKQIDSTKSLLIYDAVRPKSIQQQMWDTVKMPFGEKIKFLSNPKNHSIHNYAAAVDVTIADIDKKPLDMGVPFDYIGILAYPTKEQQLLKEGKLNIQQIENRKLLRKVMQHGGFFNIQTEWWHFNSCRRSEAKKKYALVE